MPTLHRIGSRCRIEMYPRDHPPPHFHVVRPEGRAAVAIETLEVLQGDLPMRLLREALIWAQDNRDLLRREWLALRPPEGRG
jgi:hypothetical protein